jgi:ParB family chromosome partitioning protein
MINPFKSKKGLGRGLSSLIGDVQTNESNSKMSISSIIRNKYQPRKKFDKESLEELSNSIKERGIIQPIVVRRSNSQNDKYEIVAGERRWQAAQNAGLHEVPVIIINVDNLKSLEFAIVENVQRKDLNPIEEAEGYKRLIDEFNYDQEKVAKFIGKSRAHISNCLRLLSLPKEVIELVIEEKISHGHAKILVGLENAFFLAKKIIDKKLSVRQSESLIRALKFNTNKIKKTKNPNIMSLESALEEKTGIKAFISNKKNNSGQVTFQYKDLDQLNRLIMVIKANY